MKSIFISISLFFSFFLSMASFAQSCGSGGGAEVCLSAAGTANSVNLSWTVTGNIDAVQIYRDTDSNPAGRTRIAILNAGDRSFTDSTPVAGTQYWYWVKFRASGGFYNSGAAAASLTAACNATPITPYISSAGVWSQTSTISIAAGTQIAFGPQPASGGAWSWSGCGTSGSSREQIVTPSASCSAQAVYTNSCGATTTQTFSVTVTGSSLYPSYNTNPIAPDMTGMGSNAVQIASKIKMGTNIGNTMEAYGCSTPSETCWGNPMVSAAYVKLVKDSGFDAIRIPVSWDQYANQQTAEISAAWLDRVKQVVQYAVDNGLYVVVNIHWDGGWLENQFSKNLGTPVTEEVKAAVNAKQKAYWEQIATKLRDFDEHVLFASANEPNAETAEDIAALESYHQTFVDAVRSTGGKNAYRVLIVQAPETNIDMASTDWNVMPTDTATGRQMAEVHFYPFNFTIMTQDESWGNMFFYWGNGYHSTTDLAHNATWGEEDYVDSEFAKMKAKFVDRGIPVVLGEYAVALRTQLTGDDLALHRASRAYYYGYVTRKALENGMLPFVWEVGYSDGLFDRNTPAIEDKQVYDAVVAGAGKATLLNSGPNSWALSSGATSNGSAANMQFTLNQAGSSASYTFTNPVNWSGATLKVVLNFDQAFISDRNGGADGFLQFFTYSANWAASEFKCWTANQALVAGQDTEFTCSAFSIQNAVGVGIQFPGSAGTVTIKKATISLVP